MHREGAWLGLPSFLCVGAGTTLLQYVLLVALAGGLQMQAVLASALAYAASAVVNYLANRALTFRSTRAHRVALPRFVAMSGLGLAINAGVMAVGIEGLDLHYLLAQVLATLVTLAWNYLLGRFWIFTH